MERIARGFLLVVSVVNGVLGVICAFLLLLAPDGRYLGMGVLIPVIGEFPFADVFFRDFFWIGLVMLFGLGIPNVVAAVMLLRRMPGQYAAMLIAGVLLIMWCAFELVYMYNAAAVGFLAVGVASVMASVLLLRSAGTP